MLFNSFSFLILLAAVAAAHFLLRGGCKRQNVLLLLASYFFYSCWDYRFLSLILFSTVVNFFSARVIEREEQEQIRRRWLIFAVAVNLGILGFFKYFNFFASSFAEVLSAIGLSAEWTTLQIILPVGISFFTFQTLSYTVDVYRRKERATDSLLNFSLYVAFFPQLIAGPIERPSGLLRQIERTRRPTASDWEEGLHHFLLGVFKKVIIADNMAPLANGVFGNSGDLSGPTLWAGLLAFALQIYGDFSGYSSMAQGIGKFLGFDLSYNFHMPYFATSPSDFWRRWHITLSEWLRDYLYIPLGGNRNGTSATYRNLMITMILGGLWHGAGLNFIIWGAYHGAILCIYRVLRLRTEPSREKTSLWIYLSRLGIMFFLTLLGWLFFRAESASAIGAILIDLFTTWGHENLAIYILINLAFFTGPLVVYEFFLHRRGDDHLLPVRSHWGWRVVLYGYILVMLLLFSPESRHDFIYFQF